MPAAADPPTPAVPRARSMRRAFVLTMLVSVGVALLLTVMEGGRLGPHLVHSLAIGLGCWLCIDGGRRLLARFMGPGHGWPGWPGMLASVAVGVPLGAWLGSGAAVLVGVRSSPSLVDWSAPSTQFTLVLAALATAVVVGLMSTLERAVLARADAEAAQRLATESRLRLLESQLEPHMLFNTLANLRALIAIDPPRAQAMLDRLIAFLRATLSASRHSVHPLHAEFARVDDYLALMAVRMGPRLKAKTDLPQELRDRPVPALLLQPLVENAILHGLEPQVGGGTIEVSAAAADGRLTLTVLDSGVGLGTNASGGTGFGCEQVRERLRTLYGERAGIAIEPAPGGGTVARVHLPLETAA